MAIFSDNIRTGSAAAGGGTFEITNSIRFDGMDNGYLKRTPSSTGNQKVWTWSGWIKRNTVARDKDDNKNGEEEEETTTPSFLNKRAPGLNIDYGTAGSRITEKIILSKLIHHFKID